MDWNNNFAESDWSVSPLISIVNMIMGKYEQEILHTLGGLSNGKVLNIKS